jgi:uncharacterized protein
VGTARTYEPGTRSWVDLGTPDIDGAAAFYGGLFGWTAQSYPYGEGGTSSYTGFSTAGSGALIAGMIQAPDQWRAEGPAHWAVFFEVADTDATLARAGELGGSVAFQPFDIPHVGRLAVLADPLRRQLHGHDPRPRALSRSVARSSA